jgi:REP element-mobilizing transposase RayT
MARKNRLKNGNIYSVVTRINNWREDFADERVCLLFLRHLRAVKLGANFKVYGFVIMPTHVHLCLEVSDDENETISEVMQRINGGFTQNYNKIFHERGHFWQARFKNKIIHEVIHLANTIVYFAYNPVRWNICADPLSYPFCSIQNLSSDIYSDILDELPHKIGKNVKQNLSNRKYLSMARKNGIRRYSFDLSKRKIDQQFRFEI